MRGILLTSRYKTYVIWKGSVNENCRFDCSNFTRLDVFCVWAERVPAFHPHGTDAYRACRPVHHCNDAIALPLLCRCLSGCRWRAAVDRPIHSARPYPSWPGHCKHPLVSPADGSERHTHGDRRHNPVGNRVLSPPAIFCWPLCAADGIVRSRLIPEQIRELNEYLAPVIDEAVA